MNYAVIKTGGKQYKVRENDLIRVEKLDANASDTVKIAEVLAVYKDSALVIGSPFVDGASVTASVVEQTRDKKVIVFKKTRRHNYRRKNGHRQHVTVLRITSIA